MWTQARVEGQSIGGCTRKPYAQGRGEGPREGQGVDKVMAMTGIGEEYTFEPNNLRTGWNPLTKVNPAAPVQTAPL